MPEGYEKIRNKLMRGSKKKKPMKKKDAQKHAAMIWNSLYPDNPVGRGRK